MGEAINLVENFKVEKVIFNCGEFNDLEQDLDKCKILYIPNEKTTSEKIQSDKYYKRLYDAGFTNRENIYFLMNKMYINL